MQDKIFKVKIFEVTHKSVKSVKVFSLEIFRLYDICLIMFISSCGLYSKLLFMAQIKLAVYAVNVHLVTTC